MKKSLTFFIGLVLASCLSEKGIEPGKGATFVRYFNGGNNDQAQSLEETPDGGWIIMANTKIQKAEADVPHYKIKLIRTDAQGNPVWVKLFPDIADNSVDYSGSALQLIPSGGYVIAGDYIKSNGINKALLLTVDDSGNLSKPASTYSYSYLTPLSGKGVAVEASGNYLLLTVSGSKKMRLTEMDKSTLKPFNPADSTRKPLEAGNTELAKKLLIDAQGEAVWSGVVTKTGQAGNNQTGIRMVKIIPNNEISEFDLMISLPTFTEVGTDFCKFGDSYVVTGSTNLKTGSATPGADTDILFKRIDAAGNVLPDGARSFPFGDGTTPDGQNDIGNSVSSTQDGGLILLSSVNSAALKEKGKGDTDFYLIKINAFGDKDWSNSFGSRFKDDGAVVRQATDGGYVVLGTTTQGGLKLVTLVKTDKIGRIE